ncbi:uncharacterized protein LOC142985496 [Anticarsia gemmatalis]|uniref:uncharacterized protein LOC142985496 n=1 Tax=Anticarsia gemmatalis TaxID=129554 RepID=UPI003F777645
MDIEDKFEIPLCYGCLSRDRNMSRIDNELNDFFFRLRDNETQETRGELQLCWECIALLKKTKLFQQRIQTAELLLMQYIQSCYNEQEESIPKALTTLQCTHIGQPIELSAEAITTLQSKHIGDTAELIEEAKPLPEETKPTAELSLITEIKQESDDQDVADDIIDTEYLNDIKIEKDERKNSESYRKKYQNLATIIKRDCNNDLMSYFDTVQLSERDLKNNSDIALKYDGGHYTYRCKEIKCKNVYFTRFDLQRHKTFDHMKPKFPQKCLTCRTIISSQEALQDHWSSIHSNALKCKICNKILLYKGGVKKHMRAHARCYVCKECSSEFGTLTEFINHYKSLHALVVCDYCDAKFRTKRVLTKHIQTFHTPAYCKICDRSYRSQKAYRFHVRDSHPEVFNMDGQKELSYCVECDKQYPSVYKYRKHLQQSVKHTPPKKVRVPCPDCGKIFSRTSFMNNHYRFEHLKVTKHYCDPCNKYYTTGFGLRTHRLRVHQKMPLPKDKICDICGRGFSTKKILVNHRRTHTGERPFKCKYCPAAFAQEYAMKTHQKTQHTSKQTNMGLLTS